MNVRKNLTLLAVSSLLLTLASCGNDSKSSRKQQAPEVNPICDNISCMTSINWKLVLQGQIFPEKTRVDINGETVLDECLGKQQYQINRSAAPMSLTLDNFYVPRSGAANIQIFDQGWDCMQKKSFLSVEKAQFEVVKSNGMREILFNL
jgi:hypothetical protein